MRVAVKIEHIDICPECPNYITKFHRASPENETAWCKKAQRDIPANTVMPSWCPLDEVK